MYFALIDTNVDELDESQGQGVMAFINCGVLAAQSNKKISPNYIAKELECFEFSNIQIVKFYARFFEELKGESKDVEKT
jgi:hypothetical protein